MINHLYPAEIADFRRNYKNNLRVSAKFAG
jgi:hypothetical protein